MWTIGWHKTCPISQGFKFELVRQFYALSLNAFLQNCLSAKKLILLSAPRQTALLGFDKGKLEPKKIFGAATCLISGLLRKPGWQFWKRIWPGRTWTFVGGKVTPWHSDLIGEHNNYAVNLLSSGSSTASIGSCLKVLELPLLPAIKVTGSCKQGREVPQELLCEIVGAKEHKRWHLEAGRCRTPARTSTSWTSTRTAAASPSAPGLATSCSASAPLTN